MGERFELLVHGHGTVQWPPFISSFDQLGERGNLKKAKMTVVRTLYSVHSTDLVILSCLTEHILQYITIHRLLNLAELCHMVNGSGVPPNWGPAPELPITRLTVRPNLPDQVKGPSQGHQRALSLEGPFHRTLSRGDWKPRILKQKYKALERL